MGARRRKLVVPVTALVASVAVVACVALVASVLLERPGRSVGPPTAAASTAGRARPVGDLRRSAWVPYWDDGTATRSFEAAPLAFSSLHAFWFEVKGASSIHRQAKGDELLRAAGRAGVPVVATVVNPMGPDELGVLLADPAARRAHVEALCDLARDPSFSGIDLDYEHFAVDVPDDRVRPLASGFTGLVGEVAQCVHGAGKRVEVTVMARTDDAVRADYRPKLAVGVYDYAGLGAVVDVVRPMAYDQHYPGGPSGSVDPVDWVDLVASYAVAHVPADRVELGIPLYGEDWDESTHHASSVAASAAPERARNHAAAITTDPSSGSSTFSYRAGSVEHRVWFDDSAATRARVDIAARHGLSGVAFWALGNEQADLWSSLPPAPR